MTLNGVMAVILPYFSEFGYLPGVLRKNSRSLSHLLKSSCLYLLQFPSYDVINDVIMSDADCTPDREPRSIAASL